MNESQLVELKNRLEHQESETRKDESKFEFSLAENEKLKTSFSAERTAWEKEKTILLQRAEAAESSVKETTVGVKTSGSRVGGPELCV